MKSRHVCTITITRRSRLAKSYLALQFTRPLVQVPNSFRLDCVGFFFFFGKMKDGRLSEHLLWYRLGSSKSGEFVYQPERDARFRCREFKRKKWKHRVSLSFGLGLWGCQGLGPLTL